VTSHPVVYDVRHHPGTVYRGSKLPTVTELAEWTLALEGRLAELLAELSLLGPARVQFSLVVHPGDPPEVEIRVVILDEPTLGLVC